MTKVVRRSRTMLRQKRMKARQMMPGAFVKIQENINDV